MTETANHEAEQDMAPGAASGPDIASLIAALGDQHGRRRHKARLQLVEMGSPAIAPLLGVLDDANDDVRWEAIKALSEIGDPAVIPGLLKALEDDNFGVRWLAAEGLIQLRSAALAPLFRLLTTQSGERSLREAAHHILRVLGTKGFHDQVAPVLEALSGIEPAVEAPLASRAALDALEAEHSA
jgi:HEAT repeat protein